MLDRLIDGDHLEDFLNPRSPRYKELELDRRKLSKAEAIDLILEDPNLMRRPLVLSGSKAVFGFKPEEYEKLPRR